jgi:hypothetical protein
MNHGVSALPVHLGNMSTHDDADFNRKCLNMFVTSIPSNYTHIHFTFANVTRGTYRVCFL